MARKRRCSVRPSLRPIDRRRFVGLFAVELPVTRLFPNINTTFAHRRVQGLSTPFRALPDAYIEDLSLENERWS
jgi:hypothetical protein